MKHGSATIFGAESGSDFRWNHNPFFCRLLEKYELVRREMGEDYRLLMTILGDHDLLRHDIVVDATIIHTSSLAKNKDSKSAPQMHQNKKGYLHFWGMKAHTESESGLIHGLVVTAANVVSIKQVD